MSSEGHSVGTRTLRGVFWAYGSYVGGRLLVLVSVGILARLLTPEEFGVVAFALTVTVLLDTISDLGVSQALIVVPDEELMERARTAWSVSLLMGLVLAALTAALSPAVAAFFGEPELIALLSVLGLNFILRALGQAHFAIAQKRIDFRTRTIAEMSDVVVRGVAGIVLALAGAGAWSLVLGYLAGSAAMSAALWLLVPFRPRWHIDRTQVSGLLRFGGGLTALDIASAIIANVDYVFVGRVLGAANLGLYTLGFRLPELLVLNISSVAGAVLFPAFAGLGREHLREAYLLSMRFVAMVAVPLTVGMVLLATELTLVAFGDQWRAAVPAMQVLAIFAFGIALSIPGGTAYKAMGRVDLLVKLVIPRVFLAIALIWIFVDEGIVAVAAAQAAVAGVFTMITLGFDSRLLAGGPRPIIAAAAPAFAAGAVMALPVFATARALDGPVITLLAAIPVGAAVYVAAFYALAPQSVRQLLSTAMPGRFATDAGRSA